MLQYALRRLLYSIPILLGVTLLVFLLFDVAGGNPVYHILGKNASEAEIERMTRVLGLDQPLWMRYLDYLGDLVRFDLGRSWETRQRIVDMFADGLGPTLALALPAFLLATAAALVAAMVAALHRNRWPDRVLVLLAVLGMSVTILAFIIGAQYYLAYAFDLFPISGYESGPRGLPYLALPVLIWVATQTGGDLRYYRSVFIEELNRDYVVTARAKGLSMGQVLSRHVLKNAMLPIISRVATDLPVLITGSLLLENFFGIPGLGNMSIRAVNAADFPVIKAVTLFGAAAYILANLVGDLLYAVFDPRVRLS
jgi:peptide/nickel transport system permease protein